MFGMKLEEKIIKSGVRDIFTPHTPIQSVELFFGRQEIVKKIIEHLNTPGQHALLYGDRGVGKSSLANITTKVLIENILKVNLFTKRCSSMDSFITIFREPLRSIGVEIEESSKSKSKKNGGNAGINIKIAQAGINTETTEIVEYNNTEITPSNVAEFLKETKGLLYIDEADQIKSHNDKVYLAETIKLLSDYNSPFKLLIVGISETGAELRSGHLSVERCLKETKLERMKPIEIRKLIESGSEKCGFRFDNDVLKAITDLSSGYAHFAHLLGLKCVEESISKNKKIIDKFILYAAIKEAVKDAEGTLKRNYDEAVRSASTEMFRTILYAAARIGSEYEFTAKNWRDEIEDITNEIITPQKLSSYLHRLVANDESQLIRRVGKQGVYKFNDPRMPSYIKIVNSKI